MVERLICQVSGVDHEQVKHHEALLDVVIILTTTSTYSLDIHIVSFRSAIKKEFIKTSVCVCVCVCVCVWVQVFVLSILDWTVETKEQKQDCIHVDHNQLDLPLPIKIIYTK